MNEINYYLFGNSTLRKRRVTKSIYFQAWKRSYLHDNVDQSKAMTFRKAHQQKKRICSGAESLK